MGRWGLGRVIRGREGLPPRGCIQTSSQVLWLFSCLTQECPPRGKCRERGVKVEKLPTGRSEIKGHHWVSKA